MEKFHSVDDVGKQFTAIVKQQNSNNDKQFDMIKSEISTLKSEMSGIKKLLSKLVENQAADSSKPDQFIK